VYYENKASDRRVYTQIKINPLSPKAILIKDFIKVISSKIYKSMIDFTHANINNSLNKYMYMYNAQNSPFFFFEEHFVHYQ